MSNKKNNNKKIKKQKKYLIFYSSKGFGKTYYEEFIKKSNIQKDKELLDL